MSIFNENSKVIIIGDRDGIPGPAMEGCVKTTPAEIVFQQLSVLSELLQEPWTIKPKKG